MTLNAVGPSKAKLGKTNAIIMKMQAMAHICLLNCSECSSILNFHPLLNILLSAIISGILLLYSFFGLELLSIYSSSSFSSSSIKSSFISSILAVSPEKLSCKTYIPVKLSPANIIAYINIKADVMSPSPPIASMK
jgi:hypothetical protein